MKLKIAVLSLRYNPAFVQHAVAFGKLIGALGHDVEFILDRGYGTTAELEGLGNRLDPAAASRSASVTHAVFLNFARDNEAMAAALKSRGTRILYLLHEPWQPTFEFMWTEGCLGALRAAVAHHFTVPVLKLADKVLLPSERALEAYRLSDIRHNSSYQLFPLIYDDEAAAGAGLLVDNKAYFGYLGSLCRSHGFDWYVKVMFSLLERDSSLRFLIASRNPLPEKIARDVRFQNFRSRIEVRCGQVLSGNEMNDCYASCFAVWTIYRRATQSGVLPKAWMFGTPVLASRILSFRESVEEGVTGRFASPADGPDEILRVLESFRRSQSLYRENCRKAFFDRYYFGSNLERFRSLLE